MILRNKSSKQEQSDLPIRVPFMVSTAFLASSVDSKQTKPKPLDFP